MHDSVFGASYMKPCRGKWKWDRTGEGKVNESDIIMTLSVCQSLALLETSSRSKPRGERCGRPALQQHWCRPVD